MPNPQPIRETTGRPLMVIIRAGFGGLSDFLIGFRQQSSVTMNSAWNYVRFQRGARLITGLSGSRMEDTPMPTLQQATIPAAQLVRCLG